LVVLEAAVPVQAVAEAPAEAVEAEARTRRLAMGPRQLRICGTHGRAGVQTLAVVEGLARVAWGSARVAEPEAVAALEVAALEAAALEAVAPVVVAPVAAVDQEVGGAQEAVVDRAVAVREPVEALAAEQVRMQASARGDG